MLPTLQHFETFLAVAETGGFTAAAKKMGISKAAISQTIRMLENALQVSLFIRNTRHVTLTDEGEVLFSQCQRLKQELDITRDLIGGLNASPAGTLRISCNPFFAESHLLKILQDYIQLFPKVKVEILAEERMPNMQQEQIDIVFGINWPAPEDIVAKTIGYTRYVLCASQGYLEKFGVPKNIKDLEQHHYIPHCGRSSENILTSLKKKASLNLKPHLILNSTYFMKKCALSDMGIIQLHDYMVKEELKNGSLVEILPEFFIKRIPLYIYYQKHKFVQPKIRQFVNLCGS